MSNSATPWTVAHQAPLSMGMLEEIILEWTVTPSSRGSSKPRDRTKVSHIAGRFFTTQGNLCCCSVARWRPTLCNPMDCSMPGFPVLHHLLELAQTHGSTHVHWVGDAIQPSHPLLSPSYSAFNLSQHQGKSRLFTWDGQGVRDSASASVLPMIIQDWFPLGLTDWISLQSKGPSRNFSHTTVQKHQFFEAQTSLWSNSHIHIWLSEKP